MDTSDGSRPTADSASINVSSRNRPATRAGRVSESLARRRVPIGFAAGALVWWLARPSVDLLRAGIFIACVGEALRIWAAGHLYKSREVTVSGPYRFVRHPLYVGSTIMGAGLAVASGNIAAAGVIALYLAATFAAAIGTEEAFLRQAFGDQYDRYRSGASLDPHGSRAFSVRQAIVNREYRSIVGLAVAVLLLFLKATYNGVFWGAVRR
jgi:protein-S-isoprenylcysteine O-methyltransferase Ste14